MKITIEDKEYPESLKQIKNPPKQLYLKGNVKLLKTPGIAIVGARNCTQYGEKMAKKFAKELAEFGITIISGMALGIDSYAHISTLEANGNTIAVIPSGHSNIYPKENQKLYNQILENNGLIITEYQENEKATSNKFLERNRIVSGLALGTLVVEGGKRSGTSVTARLTREQEKLVFCIPSSLENPKGITPNNLIKEGAILVTSVNDIIENYKYLKLKKTKTTKKKITNTNIYALCEPLSLRYLCRHYRYHRAGSGRGAGKDFRLSQAGDPRSAGIVPAELHDAEHWRLLSE